MWKGNTYIFLGKNVIENHGVATFVPINSVIKKGIQYIQKYV